MNGPGLARGLRRAARAVVRAARPQTRAEIVDPPQARTAAYSYAPVDDDRADPGEVVWAWVPFEEDRRKGKDRPVLVVGRDGSRLLALQLTSKDHDRDEAQEASVGRYWTDIGSGGWDRRRRPSEARVNRLLRLEPSAVRRTGAVLDEEIFDRVLQEVRRHFPQP
ncbi:type II toxin-antitoxin system PemK/MazF family toxin [Ornithinimicrobium avium]|uniref:Type II toxin-antitoxin system PemK/MazF family toxin n=1 Tax=Ornithinimicrobium avium TaxID=2283195 RepID=A0A345NIV3_9MICO|nr:type II toxin-antitoxin system PemK/MazF family toxin [Ornithinimicrobium avium]AXH94961.1 type II toxin-antitoxin system PemK/MazF family toxin [Ornithinimicrobium avium]